MNTNILYISSSTRGADSVTDQLAEELLEQSTDDQAVVVRRPLGGEIPLLSPAVTSELTLSADERSENAAADLATADTLIGELAAADPGPTPGDLDGPAAAITLHHGSALLVGSSCSRQTRVSRTRRAFSRTRQPQPPATTEQGGLELADLEDRLRRSVSDAIAETSGTMADGLTAVELTARDLDASIDEVRSQLQRFEEALPSTPPNSL